MFKKSSSQYGLILSLLLSANIVSASENNYSCSADNYSFKECKFELPTILHGQTKLESVDNGVFQGTALVLCNNGKKTIISESCDYVQGAPDSCKGIPSNTWTGYGDSMCSHSSVSISVANGDEYKVSSIKNNGYVKYSCEDSKLTVKSSECTRPESTTITTASSGSQCVSKSYSSNAEYDHINKKWIPIAPSDNFCINEGFDYLDSYTDISTQSNLNTEHKGYFNTVCCSNDTLDSPNPSIIVTPISNDCATISGVISGDLNEITGVASNAPSSLKLLNSMCKPNGYSKIESFSAKNATNGSYTFIDEFQVTASCCGNNSIADNNTECKGAFLSSGINAQLEAQSFGIPFLCDSSSGSMECFKNTCTPFIAEEELCAECVLGKYSFNANSNHCIADFPIILTGHESLQKIYNDTHSGYADVSCNNGVSSLDDARCFNNCLKKRVTWENKNKTAVCYFDLPNNKYRHYLEPTDNDRTNPNLSIGDKTDRIISIAHTGIAEFHCDDGNWVENSEDLKSPICFASCSAKTAMWGSGMSKDGRDKTNACQSTLPNQRHFKQPDFSSADGIDPMINSKEDPLLSLTTNNINSGAAKFRCNDGNWEINGSQTCNLDCNAQTVSWTEKGATASANVAANKHGTTLYNVVATSGINLGKSENNKSTSSVTNLVCDDGRYIPVAPVVAEDCKAGSITRSSPNLANACNFSWGTLRHTNSGKLLSSTNSGSVNYSCNDGKMEIDANSLVCNASCASTTVSWARTSGLSSSCLTGFTKVGEVCKKNTVVIPTCSSGLTFNNATDQCEQSNLAKTSYPAVSACEGAYANYNENGFSCEKSYNNIPKCSQGLIFNGNECESPSGIHDNGSWSCPSGYDYHSNYTIKDGVKAELYYTNVCVKSISKQPNCATGYSFNTTTGTCTTNSLTSAQLSCRAATGTYSLLVTPSMASAYTNITRVINNCSDLSINGQCCIKSNYSCRNQGLDLSFDCNDWEAYVPETTCTSGSSFNTISKKCAIVSSKSATCENNYTLSGNYCITNSVIDASLKCNDGSAAPCNDPVTAQATCSPITLEDGSIAIPSFNAPFCIYQHFANNAASRTCPSGGSAIGNVCYVNSNIIKVEAPTCSNGGSLNKITNLCEATETMIPRSFEPVRCSAAIGFGTHLTNGSITDNTQNGATGSASMVCIDGNWVANNSFCAQDCSPIISASTNSNGTMSWSTGESLSSNHPAYGMQCSTNNISMSNYSHSSKSGINTTKNSGAQLVGNIVYQCVDGLWNTLSSSCSRVTCSATNSSFSGLSTCNVSVPSMKWGDSNTLNQPLGFSGQTDAIYICGDSGTSRLSNTPDCNADCNITSANLNYNWAAEYAGCSLNNSNYLDHKEKTTIKDSSGSSRGTTTLICDNGVISKNGNLCRKATARNTTVYWNNTNGTNGTSGSCSATLPNDIMLGGASYGATDCVSVSNASSSFLGSATICATATGMIKTSGTCNASCNATSVNWSNCSGTTSSRTHGGSVSVTDGASGSYTGSATANCNNGSWSLTNTSCAATCSTTPYASTCSSGFSYNSTSKMCEKSGGSATWSYVRNLDEEMSTGNSVCNAKNTNTVTPIRTGSCSTIGEQYSANQCSNNCEVPEGRPGDYRNQYCTRTIQTCSTSIVTQSPTCPSGASLVNGMCVNSCSN